MLLSFDIGDGDGDVPIGNEMLEQAIERHKQRTSASSNEGYSGRKVPVFYNLYVANSSDATRVAELVNEQLSFLRPEHSPVYLNSIGYQIHISNTTLLKHYDKATESATLQAIWLYCKSHQDETVVYMHSKG
jgi:hypothetical protein